MKRSQGLMTALIAVLLLLLATNVMMAQQATPTNTPDPAQVNIPTFTDGRINPQAFAPVVLFCSSSAGGRLSGAQQVSGFPVITGANATPTATTGTQNENTVLTAYVLNSAGQGTLAWEFDFATGRLLVPSTGQSGSRSGQSGQLNQTITPTGTQTQSGLGTSATSTPSGSGSSTTATPTQSAAIPGNNSFARQDNVIAQAATPTPTPTDTTGSTTATATQSSAATATPGTSGSGINQTPAATVSGQTGQGNQGNRSVTLASASGVALSVSNGRYIISAPQLDGKLYQFVFDGCPNVGDFDVLVNGVPTN